MGRSLGFFLVVVVVFVLGLINTSGSQDNNWNIALLQLFFVACSWYFLRPSFAVLGVLRLVFLLIAISMAISNWLAAWDSGGLADWRRVIQMSAHMGFALAFFFWFVEVRGVVGFVVFAILASVVMYLLFFLWYWVYLEDPYSYYWISFPPLFNNIRHLGYFLCVGVVTASWAVFACSGKKSCLAFGVYVLALSLLLWSGGRGALISALGGMGVLAYRFRGRGSLASWWALFLGGGGALALSAFFDVGQSGMGWIYAVTKTVNSSSLDQVSSSRLGIWERLLPHICERPWFGWGGEGFRSVFGDGYISQAHNGILQLLIEWGAMGTLLVVGLLFWVVARGVGLYSETASSLSITAALPLGIAMMVALLLLSLVDGVFYHGMPMAFLMISCGVVGAAIYKKGSV